MQMRTQAINTVTTTHLNIHANDIRDHMDTKVGQLAQHTSSKIGQLKSHVDRRLEELVAYVNAENKVENVALAESVRKIVGEVMVEEVRWLRESFAADMQVQVNHLISELRYR